MQFRAEVEDSARGRLVRLSGRLEGEQALELVRLFDDARTAVRLDLTDLMSADAPGVEALGTLESRGAELIGTSPYFVLQLEFWKARRNRTTRPSVAGTGEAPERRNEHTRKTEDQ